MYWIKVLPESLSIIEEWIKTIFLILALLTLAPWILLLLYDFFLYIWRSLTYEMPLVGGRARGKGRPRAPSLTQRPGGEKRMLGVVDMPQIHVATPGIVERMEPILGDVGRAIGVGSGSGIEGSGDGDMRGRSRGTRMSGNI